MIFTKFLALEQSYLNDTLRVEIQQKSNQNLTQNNLMYLHKDFIMIFSRFLAEGHPTNNDPLTRANLSL